MFSLLVWLAACSGSKDDSSGSGSGDDTAASDDSATGDDSGTSKNDDSGTDDSGTDDSGTDDSGTDDSGTDDSGCEKVAWYLDADRDGYGSGKATKSCEPPGTNWVGFAWDCNDGNAAANPGEAEICDGVDNDCDTLVDDDDKSVSDPITAYLDLDGDGFAGTPFTACVVKGGSPKRSDCDDGNAKVNPTAVEMCNGYDDDCDKLYDDDDPDLAVPCK
jgi:hypothetical protein